MYKVIVTADGTTATAAQHCRTIQEAKQIRERLFECLKMPVQIDIVVIPQETPAISTHNPDTANTITDN